jgi:hypothetical protein
LVCDELLELGAGDDRLRVDGSGHEQRRLGALAQLLLHSPHVLAEQRQAATPFERVRDVRIVFDDVGQRVLDLPKPLTRARILARDTRHHLLEQQPVERLAANLLLVLAAQVQAIAGHLHHRDVTRPAAEVIDEADVAVVTPGAEMAGGGLRFADRHDGAVDSPKGGCGAQRALAIAALPPRHGPGQADSVGRSPDLLHDAPVDLAEDLSYDVDHRELRAVEVDDGGPVPELALGRPLAPERVRLQCAQRGPTNEELCASVVEDRGRHVQRTPVDPDQTGLGALDPHRGRGLRRAEVDRRVCPLFGHHSPPSAAS